MYNYPYLKDYNFLKTINTMQLKQQLIKVIVLNWNEEAIQDISGIIIDGNITINGDSAMRRTANINLFASQDINNLTNIDNLISINKKVEILIGIKNTTNKYLDYPIIWFPQGIYFINSANISHGLDGVKISISLHDKMAQLNGQCGGIIPATTILDEIEEEDEFGNIIISKPTIVQIIQQIVNHFGNEKLGRIIIKDLEPTVKQVLKWNGNTNAPLYIYNNGSESSAALNQYGLYKQIFTNLYIKHRQESNSTIDTNTAKSQAAIAFQKLILAINDNKDNVEIEILQSFIMKLKELQKQVEIQKENFQKLEAEQEELKNQLKKRYRSLIKEARRSLQNLKMNIKQVYDLHKKENQIQTFLNKDERTILESTSKDLRKTGTVSTLLRRVKNLKIHLQSLKSVAKADNISNNNNILESKWIGSDGKTYTESIKKSPQNALATALSLPHPAKGNGPNYTDFFNKVLPRNIHDFNRYGFRFPYSTSSYISISENGKSIDTYSGWAMITSGGKSASDKKAAAKEKNPSISSSELAKIKDDLESRVLFTPNVKTLSLCAFNLSNINYQALNLNYFFCFGEFLIIRKYFVNNKNELTYLPVSYLKSLEAIQKDLSSKIDTFRIAGSTSNNYTDVINFLEKYIEWCDNVEQFLNAFNEIEKKVIEVIKNSKSNLLNSTVYSFKNNFYIDVRKSTKEQDSDKNLSFFEMSKQQLQQLKEIVDLLQYKKTDTNNKIILLRENSQKIYDDIATKINNLKTNLRQLSFNNSQQTSTQKTIYTYALDNQNFLSNEVTLQQSLSNILIDVYNFLETILNGADTKESYRNTLKICSDSSIEITNYKNIRNALDNIENTINTAKTYNEEIIKNSLSEITNWFMTKAKETPMRLLSVDNIKDFDQSYKIYAQKMQNTINAIKNINNSSTTISVNSIKQGITKTASYMQDINVAAKIETYTNNIQKLTQQMGEYLPTEQFMDSLTQAQNSTISTIEQLETSIVQHEERLKNLMKQYDSDFIEKFKQKIKDKDSFKNGYWNSKITQLTGNKKTIFFNQFISSINKIKSYANGEDIGYTLTDFIYPGKLTANAGETVVSVLDKIKNTLGNFEYFYDVHGNFIFQEIKNYLNTSYSSYFLDNNTSPNYNYNLVDGKICYDFSDGEIIQSYQNAPQYNKIKNDFIVWGERKSTNGQKYPIRYHLSIDTQPEIGQIYCYTFPTITGVNRFNEDKNSIKKYRTVREPSDNKERRDFVPEGKIIDNKNTYFYKTDLPSKGAIDTYYYVKSENQFYEWVEEKNSTFYGYKIISVPITNIQSFLTRKELYEYKANFDGKTLTKKLLNDYGFCQLSTNDLYNDNIKVADIIQELIKNCIFVPSIKTTWVTSSSIPNAEKTETEIYRYKYWFYTEDTDQYYYFYIQKQSGYWVGHFTYQWFPRIKQCTVINSINNIPTSQIKYDTYYYNTKNKYIYRAITNSQTKQPELKETLLTPFSVSDYRMALFLNGSIAESYHLNETNDYYTELKNELPKIYNILPQKFTATSKLSTAYYFTTIQNNPTNMDYYLDILNNSDLVSKYGITNIGKRTQIINNNNINCIFEPNCPDIFYLNKNKPINLNQSIQNQKLEENENKEERIRLRNLYTKWNKKHMLAPFTAKIEVDNSIYENFVNGGTSRSAYEEIRSMLYDYITYNEQLTLSVLPIYYLEPNSLIKVHDETAHIIGEFMIKNISYSLTGNGLMNLSCTKVLTRI